MPWMQAIEFLRHQPQHQSSYHHLQNYGEGWEEGRDSKNLKEVELVDIPSHARDSQRFYSPGVAKKKSDLFLAHDMNLLWWAGPSILMPHHFQGFHWFNPSSISYHIWQSEQSYEHIHPSILKRRRNPSVGTIQSGCWRPSDQSAVKSAAQFCWQVTLMFHFSWPHLLTSWYRGNIVLHQDIIETLGHFFFGEGGVLIRLMDSNLLRMGWIEGNNSGLMLDMFVLEFLANVKKNTSWSVEMQTWRSDLIQRCEFSLPCFSRGRNHPVVRPWQWSGWGVNWVCGYLWVVRVRGLWWLLPCRTKKRRWQKSRRTQPLGELGKMWWLDRRNQKTLSNGVSWKVF